VKETAKQQITTQLMVHSWVKFVDAAKNEACIVYNPQDSNSDLKPLH
jgi:hypothetical protein